MGLAELLDYSPASDERADMIRDTGTHSNMNDGNVFKAQRYLEASQEAGRLFMTRVIAASVVISDLLLDTPLSVDR